MQLSSKERACDIYVYWCREVFIATLKKLAEEIRQEAKAAIAKFDRKMGKLKAKNTNQ